MALKEAGRKALSDMVHGTVKNHGNLSSRPVYPWQPTGRLPEELHKSFYSAEYAIYSYGTPIAWFTSESGWAVPEEKYSRTTTNHQNVIRGLI